MDKAMRHNTGKPRISLLKPHALLGAAAVMTFGATKYEVDNWTRSIGTDEHDSFRDSCIDSLYRHITAHQSGEQKDPESGQPHMAHAICNAMMVMEYDRYENTTRGSTLPSAYPAHLLEGTGDTDTGTKDSDMEG